MPSTIERGRVYLIGKSGRQLGLTTCFWLYWVIPCTLSAPPCRPSPNQREACPVWRSLQLDGRPIHAWMQEQSSLFCMLALTNNKDAIVTFKKAGFHRLISISVCSEVRREKRCCNSVFWKIPTAEGKQSCVAGIPSSLSTPWRDPSTQLVCGDASVLPVAGGFVPERVLHATPHSDWIIGLCTQKRAIPNLVLLFFSKCSGLFPLFILP